MSTLFSMADDTFGAEFCFQLITYSALKLVQLIQNAAARLVFNQPKSSHVTPLLRSLHWLPVTGHTEYKTLICLQSQNGYGTTSIPQKSNLSNLNMHLDQPT